MKRTNIVIDEELIEELKKTTGLKTSKAVIDRALREMARRYNNLRILSLKGKIDWFGDIETIRSSRG